MSAIKIIKYRKFEKNTLKAFLEAGLPSGLCIRDLTYHRKGDSRWVGYPSRPYEDEDGNTRYMNTIYFTDKETHYRFQDDLLRALDNYLAKQPKDSAGEDDVPF